jgi:hypothetical protein
MVSASLQSLRHFAKLCEMSYATDAIAKFESMGYFAQQISTNTSDQAFLLLNNEIRELTIVVRGTDQITDWILRNLRPIPTFDQDAEGRIARGFWAGASALAGPVRNAITLTKAQGPIQSVIITGHSLGGITADILLRQLWPEIAMIHTEVITFGAPRGGNAVFAKACPCPLVRVVNSLDPVPRFYPKKFRFKHSGSPIIWDGGDRIEYGQEAWELARAHAGDYLDIVKDLQSRIQAHFAYFEG